MRASTWTPIHLTVGRVCDVGLLDWLDTVIRYGLGLPCVFKTVTICGLRHSQIPDYLVSMTKTWQCWTSLGCRDRPLISPRYRGVATHRNLLRKCTHDGKTSGSSEAAFRGPVGT